MALNVNEPQKEKGVKAERQKENITNMVRREIFKQKLYNVENISCSLIPQK